MTTNNTTLMDRTWGSLKGKWGLAIGAFLIYMIIMNAAGAIRPPGAVISLILGGPFALGAAIFSLSISRGQEPKLEMIFQGFGYFTNALTAYLLMVLYVLLWSLLLIVPGIIAALSYAMTFYILADDPSLKGPEALRKSKAMMDGHKAKLFYLFLLFLLLALLCVLTFGIGFLWYVPFVHVTMANFYEDIRTQQPTNEA